jgi:hypothetical protein
MAPEQQNRPRIADIIKGSGKMAPDEPGAAPSQLAAMAAAIAGGSADMILASQALAEAMSTRFHLSTQAAVERDFPSPYETTARALILALQACKYVLSAAFDTASGSMVEAKKPLTLTSGAFTLTIAIVDRDSTTHFAGHAEHIGVDWGLNERTLNELFAKTEEYLALFKS